MNGKLILIGGLAFWIATWIVSMATGPLIHNGILLADYQALSTFWRPELMEQPPDMAALMPRWITTGLILSFIVAGLYGVVRGAIAGSGWLRGAKYGFGVSLVVVCVMLSYSGVFNLPDKIWAWWAVDTFAMYVIGGAALGWVADRWAPATPRAPAATVAA